MWKRYTERARQIIFFAQEETLKFGEAFYIGPEHLLLGLTRVTDTVAARVLERLGVSLAEIYSQVEKELPRGETLSSSEELQLTPVSKQVIDYAHEEATSLKNNYIGSEHILLGLLRQGGTISGKVLSNLGVEYKEARQVVVEIQAQPEAETNQIELLKRAIRAASHTHSPYSEFPVGAAVIAAESGKIYEGCNIENASYGLTICAERVAIFNAISHGEKRIGMLACACIKGNETQPRSLMPCGACLQVMAEFMNDDSTVVIGFGNRPKAYRLDELLPEGFRLQRSSTRF